MLFLQKFCRFLLQSFAEVIKPAFLTFILLFLYYNSIAQHKHTLDSLLKAYEKLSSDTARFQNLVDQVAIYRLGQPEKAMEVSHKMYELSKKNRKANIQCKGSV